jgi:uncharacterized protein (DUF2147 family)
MKKEITIKYERNVIMKKLLFVLIFCLLGSVLFAQTDLTGTWNTGKENTLVKIYEKEGVYFGELISSDNPKAQIGRQLIKDLKNEKGEWKGKLYAPKKKEWVDAEMDLVDDDLNITIKAGFFKKTIEWKKVASASENKETDKEE